MMILLSYDGSADAQAAIDHAAELMPGATATILTVWEPFAQTVARTAMGIGMTGGWSAADAESADASVREAALETATEGSDRATAAGLVAKSLTESCDGDVASTILAVAADADADVIVMGTRGRSGVKAFLLGSVSHAIVQHADRAVLIVPSRTLAEQRRGQAHHQPAHA